MAGLDQAGVDELMAAAVDPEKRAALKARIMAEGKRENPHLSDEALEAQWKLAEQLFL